MFPQLGLPEMIVVMGVAVLLFGKRLPEVGRSLGKGIVEFKKGLRGIEEEFESASSSIKTPAKRYDDYTRPADPIDTSVPKFEPPTQAPVPQNQYSGQPYQD